MSGDTYIDPFRSLSLIEEERNLEFLTQLGQNVLSEFLAFLELKSARTRCTYLKPILVFLRELRLKDIDEVIGGIRRGYFFNHTSNRIYIGVELNLNYELLT